MREKLYAEPAKLYPCLQQDQNLDLRLKEINSFNNSIQNIKDFQIFIIMKLKSIKRNLKFMKL